MSFLSYREPVARKTAIVHFCMVTLIAIYVFAFEYLPLQDYPNWLYQGFLFKEFVFHGNTFDGFFRLYPYIPPNAVSTVVIGILCTIVSPLIAGKIFLFLTAVILYFGIYTYLSFFIKNQNIFISAVAFYLVFNLHFLMGFLNFSIGLGLSLLVMIYLAKNGLKVNRWILSGLLLLLYLSHFLALLLVILFLVVYSFQTKKYKSLWSLLPAFVPVMLLSAEYYFAKSISDLPSSPNIDNLAGKIRLILHNIFSVIIPFHHYKWLMEPGLFLQIATYIFCSILSVLIFLAGFKAWKARKWALQICLSLVLLVTIIITPYYFGGVMFPSSRLSLFFILNILAILFSADISMRWQKIRTAVVAILLVVSFLYNCYYAHLFSEQVASEITPIDAIMQPTFSFEGTDGFAHLIFYHGITHREALPGFKSGLFDYSEERKGVSFGNR